MSNKITNILICGVGGQGVLKASEIIGWAALFEGYHVKKSEIHGMSQRGGSVESYIRFGKQVFSPIIPKGAVSFLVPLDIEEHLLFTDYLASDGLDLIDVLKKATTQISNIFFLNTFMLGVLSQKTDISLSSWQKALELMIPQKSFDDNYEIFNKGRQEPLIF